jgi:hypothetical protein
MSKQKKYTQLGIRNCIFRFRCDRKWESLKPTENAGIRSCDDCGKFVYRCQTDEELVDAVSQNRCVAVFRVDPANDINSASSQHPPQELIAILGDVSPSRFSTPDLAGDKSDT